MINWCEKWENQIKVLFWEFFEQRADGKGFVSSSNLCTFEIKVPDRSNY